MERTVAMPRPSSRARATAMSVASSMGTYPRPPSPSRAATAGVSRMTKGLGAGLSRPDSMAAQ